MEAWMDVCAQVPGCNRLWRMDVTIRSKFASYDNTESKPEAAATAGVKAKRALYGEQVVAIAFEPLGRLASEPIDGLWEVATEAASRRCHRSVANMHWRWRLQMERTLLWSTAEIALLATEAQASARCS